MCLKKTADTAKMEEKAPSLICVDIVVCCNVTWVCVFRVKKSKDSIKFIAQGAFRGMIHEVYLMLGNKSEEKKSKTGHLAIVISLI